MNIKLLRKIQKQILAEPKQFEMDQWFRIASTEEIPNCGTTACIAGWAVTLSSKVKGINPLKVATNLRKKYKSPTWTDGSRLKFECAITMERRARLALQITEEEAERLFFETYWPKEFWISKFNGEVGTLVGAQKAVARIDHFIKTKGKE